MIKLYIKEIASSKGMQLKDICEKIGYKSLPSFYRQINNPENLSMQTLIKIAEAINCEVRDLFINPNEKHSVVIDNIEYVPKNT